MAKNIKLLLVENVEALGIVGDVVNVRIGYARNFLLPRSLATQPTDELVKSLAAKRAEAEKQVAQMRKQREDTSTKLQGVELELVRSCNDQGILYGAITQQDVATSLGSRGYIVKARDVRLPGAIKRIDKYDVHIKLDSDLDSIIKLIVKPDRELPKDAEAPAPAKQPTAEGAPAEAGEKSERPDRAERPERGERGDRPDRGDRGDRGDRSERFSRKRADLIEQAIQADKARVVGWGGKKDGNASAAANAASSADGEKKGKSKKADGEAKAEKKSEPKAEKKAEPKAEKKSDKAKK